MRKLLACAILTTLPALTPAALDKKADEEYKKINPPVPYRLYIGDAPDKHGADKLRKIFDAKNVDKKWRPFYDSWFQLVPAAEDAEIVIAVEKSGVETKPGYKPLYYITGKLTVRGLLRDHSIRGDGTLGLWNSDEEFDLMGRVVRYMRNLHKAEVLAHTAAPARAPEPSAKPVK